MSSYIYWGNRAASTFEENTQPRALTPRHEDEVIAAYQAGISQAKIGEMFGVHQSTVGDILKRHGIKTRGVGRPRALSPEEEGKVVAAYEAGMSQPEIGEVFGVHQITVSNILKRHGIKAREPGFPRALSPEEEDEVIAAYEAGMSQPEIGEVFGVHQRTVSNILKRHGVKTRELWQHRALSPREEDEVVAAYEAGMSQAEIGEVFGVHQVTVSNILKRHGVKTRDPRALSPEEGRALVGAYMGGSSGVVLSEIFGISDHTVYKILKRHGVKTREQWPRALSPEEEDEVIAAYEAGMSQAEIGEVFGVSQVTVSNILKRHGIKTREGRFHRALSPKRNPADGVSTVLALAAVSFLVLGVSMARGARPR
jgi:DNA-directed RNA polymerase specialized sigma24 family protein